MRIERGSRSSRSASEAPFVSSDPRQAPYSPLPTLSTGQVAYHQYVTRGLVGWSAWSRYPTGQPPGCVASLGDLAVKGGWTECTPHEGARDRMSAAIDERAGNQGADGTGSCAIHIRNTPQTLRSMRDHHLESQLRAGPLVRAIKADMVSRIRARLRSQSFGPSP